jgi:hypothetical protein
MTTKLFNIDPTDGGEFAWVEHASMFHYVEGFEEAAQVLLKQIESDDGVQATASDRLVYPLIFLCRHSIELRLKELIEEGNRCLGTSEKSTGHHLMSLWASGRRIILTAWPGHQVAGLDATDAVIAQFHQVDIRSDSFRYPRSLDGKPSLPGIKRFSIRPLVEATSQVTEALDGATVGIYTEHEMRTEMAAEMRMEMAAEYAEYNEP